MILIVWFTATGKPNGIQRQTANYGYNLLKDASISKDTRIQWVLFYL